MSVHFVTRKVDTVIVEMDELTAHKVMALLRHAYDDTTYPGDLTQLAVMLSINADIGNVREFDTNVEHGFVRIGDLRRVE